MPTPALPGPLAASERVANAALSRLKESLNGSLTAELKTGALAQVLVLAPAETATALAPLDAHASTPAQALAVASSPVYEAGPDSTIAEALLGRCPDDVWHGMQCAAWPRDANGRLLN